MLKVKNHKSLGTRAKNALRRLGIRTVSQLKEYVKNNNLEDVDGIGEQTKEEIMSQIVGNRVTIRIQYYADQGYARIFEDDSYVVDLRECGHYRSLSQIVESLDLLNVPATTWEETEFGYETEFKLIR